MPPPLSAGHARASITMGLYAHVLPKQQTEVADNIGFVLFAEVL